MTTMPKSGIHDPSAPVPIADIRGKSIEELMAEMRERLATVPLSEILERAADLRKRVGCGERVIVERRGKPLFALVPIEDAEYMELREDMRVDHRKNVYRDL